MAKILSFEERVRRDLRCAADEAIISLSEIVRLSDEIAPAQAHGATTTLPLRARVLREAVLGLRADLDADTPTPAA